MSDSIAWCILAGFKITSVFSRIIYHTIESVCEFAVNILQGYVYAGKKSVPFNVTKKIKQKNRKSSIRLKDDESRNEERKNKNCKTNDSLMSENMSKSTNIDQNMLTISGQRFSLHGTDKIIECNLQDANKVTVSFDFYPFKNQSMLEIKTSSRLDEPDSQKKMVETDEPKPKMSTDPKQPNGKLNQNEIPREASRLKYKDQSKCSDEILNTNNTLVAENDLEITLNERDASINGHGSSYGNVKDPLSNEHRLESPVNVSQDIENLVKEVSHGEDSLGRDDKQWSDNNTVVKSQKTEISVDLTCINKKDITILAEETRRPTFNHGQINLENNPEYSIINQTPSPFGEKQIQQTISENQQSGIKKDSLIHSEQYQTRSTPAPSYLPATGIDKFAFENNKKNLAESTADKNKPQQQSHNDKSRMSDSLDNKDKNPVVLPASDQKPLSEYPDNSDKKSVNKSTPTPITEKPAPTPITETAPTSITEETAPTSITEETTPTPITEETTPTPITEETTPTPITEETTPTPITEETTPTAKTEEPVPTPEEKSTPEAALTPETQNEVSKEIINTTKAASEQSINFNAVESNCHVVEEMNEGDNTDSSSIKEPESQTQSIDTDGFHEDFSHDINEILEIGPSIVIAPDILLNPDMTTNDTGIRRLGVSNIEMNSKYMQDGWDESDKCFYEYVIKREKEMGQYDPTAFKKEFSNETDKCDKNNSKGENAQCDSSVKFGAVIDQYNPMTEVPKYYDLIRVVDSKYILEKSRIKCYKKREVIDNFKGAENTNKTDDPKVSSEEAHNRTNRQSPRETRNADHNNEASAFSASSGEKEESRRNVKTVEELGARPKTYPPNTRK